MDPTVFSHYDKAIDKGIECPPCFVKCDISMKLREGYTLGKFRENDGLSREG